MSFEDLKRIAASVDERRGWDFSKVRDKRDTVPWDYVDVVCRYLQPSDHVLDIGTGGGERFLAIAPHFHTGVGIDASARIIDVARENRPPSLADKISFEVMAAGTLRFPDNEFDGVLNRHCPVHVTEIVRVLRPGGVFITQQVGVRNTRNICELFGCGPGGQYEIDESQELVALTKAFRECGCHVICNAEYDVRYCFLDVESLAFWLKAVPMPEDFSIDRHWQQVERILTEYHTPRGIETNEHRELLIVQKR